MNDLTTDTKPRRRTDVAVTVRDDRTVLTDPTGTTHVLNPTAHALWVLCDGSTSASEMADAVCDVFSVDRGQAIRDVTAALGAFVRDGLVEVDDRDERRSTVVRGR